MNKISRARVKIGDWSLTAHECEPVTHNQPEMLHNSEKAMKMVPCNRKFVHWGFLKKILSPT